jgi:hypothetical protein
MPRAVALLSGGLDSMLSVRVMQQQGFEVEALNIRTIYSCCQATASQAALALDTRLTVVSVEDDYLEVIRNPLYGYGKGVNPCIDCRIHMCRMAKRFMEEVNACVVVTGEIAGQRPMSQKKHQLQIIACRSGLDGRLLRPLCAKLLPPTIAELEGLVDRQQLYDFNGRGRRQLIDLAARLNVSQVQSPSTGCALTEPSFAPRVHDLLQFCPNAIRWDFELLNFGRHFRIDRQSKIVLGRNIDDNAAIRLLAARDDVPEAALLVPLQFPGPEALVVGRVTATALQFAGALILRYARPPNPHDRQARLTQSHNYRVILIRPDQAAESAMPL